MSFLSRGDERAGGSERAGATTTRRGALRRFLSAGVLATAGAGMSELLGARGAQADAAPMRLPATMVLNALPADAPADLRAAIESGCCMNYYRDEFHCGSGGCGPGWCCYHVVGCGRDEVLCINVSCAEGNFSSGC